MAERKAISKKLRFEVFKRDKFTCQYCGRTVPDVILQIDHIVPIAKGGKNDILNLITSCRECNLGKGATELSDDSVVKKQQAQIHELAEKNEQLEMMLKWRDGLMDLRSKETEKICEYFSGKTGNKISINENGQKKIKKWLREFNIIEIMDAVDIAVDQYYSGTNSSADYAFNKIPGICNNKKNGQSKNSYWFNYLKKACFSKYGDSFGWKIDSLKVICFRDMKDDGDFETAKTILYKNSSPYWFINNLEDAFR